MAVSNRDYYKLLELADNPDVAEKIKAIIETGGAAQAARKMGINERNIHL